MGLASNGYLQPSPSALPRRRYRGSRLSSSQSSSADGSSDSGRLGVNGVRGNVSSDSEDPLRKYLQPSPRVATAAPFSDSGGEVSRDYGEDSSGAGAAGVRDSSLDQYLGPSPLPPPSVDVIEPTMYDETDAGPDGSPVVISRYLSSPPSEVLNVWVRSGGREEGLPSEEGFAVSKSRSLNPRESRSLNPRESRSLGPRESHSLGPRESHSLGPRESHSLGPRESRSLTQRESRSLNPPESRSLKPRKSRSLNPRESHSLGPRESHSLSNIRPTYAPSVSPRLSEIDDADLSQYLRPSPRPADNATGASRLEMSTDESIEYSLSANDQDTTLPTLPQPAGVATHAAAAAAAPARDIVLRNAEASHWCVSAEELRQRCEVCGGVRGASPHTCPDADQCTSASNAGVARGSPDSDVVHWCVSEDQLKYRCKVCHGVRGKSPHTCPIHDGDPQSSESSTEMSASATEERCNGGPAKQQTHHCEKCGGSARYVPTRLSRSP
ncbi:PREDICTED: uncharacterized protein LOC106807625 isoform X2 [Priapulus caudatus]|uniref:Uncharacterized protein LOC106807625 isoform X2 n=1 Tax=Priapulus caudatus TaxID=37621 RepID=A0ABM1DZY5_PRICU|nr:PREDICTED: uncharacterized protein LOC106807625 isoform X2 [Priapulus caudatus]